MSAILAIIITWAKHNIARTVGVAIVGLLIFSIPYMIYSKGYNVGYHKGYSAAISERPTYGTVGTVVNTPADEFKFLGIRFNVWKLNLKLGI